MSHQAPVSVAITLGGGVDLTITKTNQLVMIAYTGDRIDLGLATMDRFAELTEYIRRLQIHAIEKKVL